MNVTKELEKRLARKEVITKETFRIWKKRVADRTDAEQKTYDKMCIERKENNARIKELKAELKGTKVSSKKEPEVAEKKEGKKEKVKKVKPKKEEVEEEVVEESEGEEVGESKDEEDEKEDEDKEETDEDDDDEDF